MTEKQATLVEFIDLMEKWVKETSNRGASLFIQEWKSRATEEQRKIISPLPLTPQMVIDFAEAAAAHLWLLWIKTINTPDYKQRLEESRAFLQIIHQKATGLGVQVDIKKIDLPLKPSVPTEWAQRKKV